MQPDAPIAAHPDRVVIFATIDDAEHFSPEQRAQIVASYPEHEREARTRGIPVLGSGRIFPVAEDLITCEPFRLPAHWPQVNGIDFGDDHPFAAVNCAWDRDGDVFYICKEFRIRRATPIVEAAAVKAWGAWIPTAWPHDGYKRDKQSKTNKTVADLYGEQGLAMMAKNAMFPDGGNGVEAGVTDMLDRMQTGRFKVFSTCQAWLGEFRLYHRKDGQIVKLQDDLISASRYAFMMRRFAALEPREQWDDVDDRGRSAQTGY